jgi:hypothetical protein
MPAPFESEFQKIKKSKSKSKSPTGWHQNVRDRTIGNIHPLSQPRKIHLVAIASIQLSVGRVCRESGAVRRQLGLSVVVWFVGAVRARFIGRFSSTRQQMHQQWLVRIVLCGKEAGYSVSWVTIDAPVICWHA